MSTFMERVAYAGSWFDAENTGLDPSGPDPSADAIPRETLADPFGETPKARQKALLASLVAAEILPRVARSRQGVAAARSGATPVKPDADTLELVRLLMTEDVTGAVALVDTLRSRGATPASLYLGLVTEAAHHLGELWNEDRCDFTDVTIAMGRLQQVLRAISPHFQLGSVRRAQAESVVLAPAPGEQHTFGLVMLAEFFRREGWYVAGGPATSATDAAEIVRRTWTDVAGFSIGSAARLEGLAQCIRAVRRASRNPNLYVMVGGPLLLSRPDLAARVGADAAAADAAGAVRQAWGLLATQMAAD